jgi:hypothetical protein
MKIQVALVPLDMSYFQDRVIAGLKGGQKYGHAAFILHEEWQEPVWYDVHWRWFQSDLRVILAKDYGWTFDLFDLPSLTEGQHKILAEWLKMKEGDWVRYDLVGALYILMGWLLGWAPPDSPRSYTCFEFITRGLVSVGMALEYNPEKALATDLLGSGILVPVGEAGAR